MDDIGMYFFALLKLLIPAVVLYFVVKLAVKHAIRESKE